MASPYFIYHADPLRLRPPSTHEPSALDLYLREASRTALLDARSERALTIRIHLAEGALQHALSRLPAAAGWLLELGERLSRGEFQPREVLLLPPSEPGQERTLRAEALGRFSELYKANAALSGGGLRVRARLARAIRQIRLNAPYLRDLCQAVCAAGPDGELVLRLEQDLAAARSALAQANLRFVVKQAFKYRRGPVPVADLIQEGNLGLMRAIERFDASRGLRFTTFAAWSVKDAMTQALDAQARIVRLPSGVARATRSLLREERSLANTLGRDPGVEELADGLGWTIEAADGLRANLPSACPFSSGEDDDRPFPEDLLGAEEPSPLEVYEAKVRHRRLVAAVNDLPRRERDLLRLRFGLDGSDGCTLRQAGERLGVSGARAQQIEAKALKCLRERLEAEPKLQRTA